MFGRALVRVRRIRWKKQPLASKYRFPVPVVSRRPPVARRAQHPGSRFRKWRNPERKTGNPASAPGRQFTSSCFWPLRLHTRASMRAETGYAMARCIPAWQSALIALRFPACRAPKPLRAARRTAIRRAPTYAQQERPSALARRFRPACWARTAAMTGEPRSAALRARAAQGETALQAAPTSAAQARHNAQAASSRAAYIQAAATYGERPRTARAARHARERAARLRPGPARAPRAATARTSSTARRAPTSTWPTT